MELEEDIKGFAEYLKRPRAMNKHTAEKLIDDLFDIIAILKSKIKLTTSRMEKNTLYIQIANRETQIKWASTHL